MTEQEVRSFLAQFDRSREEIKTWPKWMQDAAVERAATFPKPPTSGVATPFSDFIRNASPEEKAKVYGEVMDRVSEQQRAVISGVAPCGNTPYDEWPFSIADGVPGGRGETLPRQTPIGGQDA